MAEKTAILFPGQGSQVDGMRALVERHEPELLELALDAVGADPFARVEEGTRFAQPAILCTSIALWGAAGRPRGEYFAGHSLGELAALAAAGAIRPADAVALAAARGRLMQDAAEANPGGMLAVRASAADAAEVVRGTGAIVANDNAPAQTVLAGTAEALAVATERARARGIRALELPVAGAFHSAAMASAVDPFRAVLAEVEIAAPRIPVISSSSARELDVADLRERLASAITSPVRWRETLLALRQRGVATYLETGPGKALTGMVRRTLDGAEARVLETEELSRV